MSLRTIACCLPLTLLGLPGCGNDDLLPFDPTLGPGGIDPNGSNGGAADGSGTSPFDDANGDGIPDGSGDGTGDGTGSGTGGGGEPLPPLPNDLPTASSCQTGAIVGRLCPAGSPNPLAAARILIQAADCLGVGHNFTAVTADNGHFSLVGLPPGTHDVGVEHEDYTGSFEVTVVAGQITTLDSGPGLPVCSDPGIGRVAVITGEYDPVQRLFDSVGVAYNVFSHVEGSGTAGHSQAYDLLSSLDAMSSYDVLLFACGALDRDFLGAQIQNAGDPMAMDVRYNFSGPIYDNLKAFVAHGGNIYASDWAWPIVEGLSPTMVDFWGDESTARPVLVGTESWVSGDVADPTLASFLASDSIQLNYDLGGWAAIDGVGPSTYVFVSGDVSVDPFDSSFSGATSTQNLRDRPLLVGSRPIIGGGVVLYTTFHYHSQPTQEVLDVLSFMIFQL